MESFEFEPEYYGLDNGDDATELRIHDWISTIFMIYALSNIIVFFLQECQLKR